MNTILIASLCLIWGSTWAVIKIGLGEAPPFYSAAFRFLLSMLVLGVVLWLGRRSLPRDRGILRWILIPGFFMYFGSYAAVYYAEQYIDSALAAILFGSFPFFVAIGAHFYLPGERLSWLKMLGLMVGFTGIVVILGGGVSATDSVKLWAMGIMLLSPLSSAIASVLVKRHLTREDPLAVNFLQMLFGVILLFPLAMIRENFADFHWTVKSVSAVTFLAVFGSAFAFVTYYHLLRTMEAVKLSLIAFVTPVVAACLGWLVFGERFTLATVIGTILVFAGIWIVNILAASTKSVPAWSVR